MSAPSGTDLLRSIIVQMYGGENDGNTNTQEPRLSAPPLNAIPDPKPELSGGGTPKENETKSMLSENSDDDGSNKLLSSESEKNSAKKAENSSAKGNIGSSAKGSGTEKSGREASDNSKRSSRSSSKKDDEDDLDKLMAGLDDELSDENASNHSEAKGSKSGGNASNHSEAKGSKSGEKESNHSEAKGSKSGEKESNHSEAKSSKSSAKESNHSEAKGSKSGAKESNHSEAKGSKSGAKESNHSEAKSGKSAGHSNAEKKNEPEKEKELQLLSEGDEDEELRSSATFGSAREPRKRVARNLAKENELLDSTDDSSPPHSSGPGSSRSNRSRPSSARSNKSETHKSEKLLSEGKDKVDSARSSSSHSSRKSSSRLSGAGRKSAAEKSESEKKDADAHLSDGKGSRKGSARSSAAEKHLSDLKADIKSSSSAKQSRQSSARSSAAGKKSEKVASAKDEDSFHTDTTPGVKHVSEAKESEKHLSELKPDVKSSSSAKPSRQSSARSSAPGKKSEKAASAKEEDSFHTDTEPGAKHDSEKHLSDAKQDSAKSSKKSASHSSAAGKKDVSDKVDSSKDKDSFHTDTEPGSKHASESKKDDDKQLSDLKPDITSSSSAKPSRQSCARSSAAIKKSEKMASAKGEESFHTDTTPGGKQLSETKEHLSELKPDVKSSSSAKPSRPSSARSSAASKKSEKMASAKEGDTKGDDDNQLAADFTSSSSSSKKSDTKSENKDLPSLEGDFLTDGDIKPDFASSSTAKKSRGVNSSATGKKSDVEKIEPEGAGNVLHSILTNLAEPKSEHSAHPSATPKLSDEDQPQTEQKADPDAILRTLEGELELLREDEKKFHSSPRLNKSPRSIEQKSDKVAESDANKGDQEDEHKASSSFASSHGSSSHKTEGSPALLSSDFASDFDSDKKSSSKKELSDKSKSDFSLKKSSSKAGTSDHPTSSKDDFSEKKSSSRVDLSEKKSSSKTELSDKDSEEDEDEEAPIGLSVRQPSYSSLTAGHLVLKGDKVEQLPCLDEGDETVVLTGSPQQPPKLPMPNLDDDQYIEQLQKRNLDKWKAIGYDPDTEVARGGSQHTFDIPTLQPKKQPEYRNSSYAAFGPAVQEIIDSKKQKTGLVRVNSSGDRKKELVVQMPKPTEERIDDDFEQEEDEDEEDVIENVPPRPLAKGWEPQPFTGTATTPQNIDSRMVHTGGDSRDNDEFPVLSAEYHLDLSELRTTQGYDTEQGSSRIPPRLYDMITHPKESIVFLALCGVSIVGYQEKLINETMSALKWYLNKCIRRGYLEESYYVQTIIENIQREQSEMREMDAMEPIEEMNTELDEVKEAKEKKEQEWANKLAQLEAEKEIAMDELAMKYQQERERIDKEWGSDKMKSKYSRPSAKLIEMRTTAKRMLQVKRFEEAAMLSEQITAREAEEANDGAHRMRVAYKAVIANLDKKFANDKDSLDATYKMKKHQLERSRDRELMPYNRRVTNYTAKIESAEETAKRAQLNRTYRAAETPQPKFVIRPDTVIGSRTAKLKLPTLKPAPRSRLGSNTNTMQRDRGSRPSTKSGGRPRSRLARLRDE